MNLLRKILIPIVPIYYGVTWLRNKLYDNGIKSSKSYDFPVVCVGNLSVGGTGKTPMIEYLIRLLKEDYKVATLSRGYKRKTNGFQLANADSTAETIGDEPFQFYNKFSDKIMVAVDANRQEGIAGLRNQHNNPEVILLDDAFQHRKINAGLNILLTPYNDLYVDDFVLPTGNLREPKSGSNRANIIVVTKCPVGLSETEKEKIIIRINPSKKQQVFFSTINYSNALFSSDSKLMLDDLKDFTLVTGIANASPLIDYLKSQDLKFDHLNFKDHHDFSITDIKALEKYRLVVATEKDFMRLKQFDSLREKLFYLPITIGIDRASEFDSLIKCFVKDF